MVSPLHPKTDEGDAPRYPTLRSFQSERRRLLKGLAAGAVTLGAGGLLAACLADERGQRDRLGNQGSDSGVDSDAGSPDLGSDELPSPGGAPAPEFQSFRLPEQGHFEVFLRSGHLSFAVVVQTYSEVFAQHYRDVPATGLQLCAQAFHEADCASLTGGLRKVQLEQAAAEALEQGYRESEGLDNGHWVETLQLSVDFCSDEIPMEGDMPSPSMP